MLIFAQAEISRKKMITHIMDYIYTTYKTEFYQNTVISVLLLLAFLSLCYNFP